MKCPFILSNDLMPTRQGEIGTVLLSFFEDGHYSNRNIKRDTLYCQGETSGPSVGNGRQVVCTP